MSSLVRLVDPAKRLPHLAGSVQWAWWQVAATADHRQLLEALARRPDRDSRVEAAAAGHHRAVVRAARPRMHPVSEEKHGRWPHASAPSERWLVEDQHASGWPGSAYATHTPQQAATCHVGDLRSIIDELHSSPDAQIARAIARRADLPDDLVAPLARHLVRADSSRLYRKLLSRGPHDVATPLGRGALALCTLLHGVDPTAIGSAFTDPHAAALVLVPSRARYLPPLPPTSTLAPAKRRSEQPADVVAQRELEAVVLSGLLTDDDIADLPVGACLRAGSGPRDFQSVVFGVLGQMLGDDTAAWGSVLELAGREPAMRLSVAAAISLSPAAAT